jgi:hypothetical protein
VTLPSRPRRAGDTVEDFYRACKTDRMHTVIVVDPAGQPLRVSCGFCRSEHNYRGGPRIQTSAGSQDARRATEERRLPGSQDPAYGEDATRMTTEDHDSLEALVRRVIREEAGLTPVAPAARWRGGTLVLRPGTPGLQEKTWPIDTFFHKVVMIRNRLCYGTLTSFNLLFADERDQFKGAGGE